MVGEAQAGSRRMGFALDFLWLARRRRARAGFLDEIEARSERTKEFTYSK